MEELLRRSRYQRAPEFRGYRNGHLPERTIGVGMGAVEVRIPRVRDLPQEVAPAGFESAIGHRYERRSQTQARLLGRLYLEGLSSGDFEPVFRALVGSAAALSPNSILRLKQEWAQEYQLWRARPLTERYAYLFADGVYLKAGLEQEKTVLLVVIGVRADGRKEPLAIEEGYRESRESWAQVLRSLRDRGMIQPSLLAVGDGGLGLWAALDELFPETRPTSAAGTTAPSTSWTSCPAGSTRCTRPPTASPASSSSGSPTAPSCAPRDRRTPPTAWSGTGTTSSPSTTSPRSAGATSAPATPSSPSSPGCDCAPMPPNACGSATMCSTWCSNWPPASAPTGAGSTPPTSSTYSWPATASWTASSNSPNHHRSKLPLDLDCREEFTQLLTRAHSERASLR